MSVCVGGIARRQVIMGRFAPEAAPPVASDSEDEDDNDGDDNDASNDDDNGEASSTNEISTWHSYLLSLVTKRGSSFGYKSSHS